MTQKTRKSRAVSQRLSMALGHPIRIDALRILNERVASPSELAKELGKGLSQVSYHVKELRKGKCIELVKTEPRRGAVEHYYRATVPPVVGSGEWPKLPKSSRQEISATILQTVLSAAAGSLQAGAFDERDDRHLSWMPMVLDEQGWGELTELLARSREAAEQIKSASAERLNAAGEPGIPTMLAMMGFETVGAHGVEAEKGK